MTESLLDQIKPTTTNDSRPMQRYKAFGIEHNKKRQTRLDIRRKDGNGTLLYYPYISTIEYSGSQHLSIIYHGSVMNFYGKKLDELIEPLQDEKIRYLQEFDPKIHTESLLKDEVVIKQIEFMSIAEKTE